MAVLYPAGYAPQAVRIYTFLYAAILYLLDKIINKIIEINKSISFNTGNPVIPKRVEIKLKFLYIVCNYSANRELYRGPKMFQNIVVSLPALNGAAPPGEARAALLTGLRRSEVDSTE